MKHILLVEDNSRDALLVNEALKETGIPYTLKVVTDGEEALLLLQSGYRPDLIFLDLNLPKVSGLEVLYDLKADIDLCFIPVIVLTNSLSERDVIAAYFGHCNAYIRKPLGFEAIINMVDQVTKFWFGTVTLPNLCKL